MTEIAYVALGSNVGDRAATLAAARAAIAQLPGTHVIAESSVEETAPLGPPDQAQYLNQMIALQTDLEPDELLSALQEIENALGRVRRERWAPRTLDLDIVRYGDRRVESPDLTLPHPELQRRDFWQRELAELGAR